MSGAGDASLRAGDSPTGPAESPPERGEQDAALRGAFLSIWHRVALLSALAVIFVSGLSRPASPADEEPILLGQPRTVSTELGEVEIAAVKVYSSGALVEVHARLSAAPGALLARPDQVLGTGSQHGEFALTLRNGTTGIGSARSLDGGFRSLDPEPGVRPHHWDLAFWVPRAAWPDTAPHLVWPVARLDTPLQLNRVELSRAAMVVRTRG